jgi:drug/metabolite transporter (DMT)-like permease
VNQLLNPYYTGVALVLTSAFGFGLMPIFAIFTYQEGLDVNSLLVLRFTLTALALFAFLWLKREPLALTRRLLGGLFVLGTVGYSLQAWFYFSAVRYIPASLAVLLLYTYPILVALLSRLVDKEKLTGCKLLAIALASGGLCLVLGASPAAVDLHGVLLAFAAAVVYSGYITLGNRVVREVSPAVTSAFVALFAAVAVGLSSLAGGSLNFQLTPSAWLGVFGIIGFSTLLAMLTFFRGLALIGPTRASILSMVEPLVTVLFSALLFADRLSLIQLAGGVAVLAGAVLVVTKREETETAG